MAKGHVTRFQAAYIDTQEIKQFVSRMNAGGRRSRRWLTEDDSLQAATGTEGRGVNGVARSRKRRGLDLMFGHQLRLIK